MNYSSRELKGDNDMNLKNFYNQIDMCLNAVTRLQEDLLPDYHSTKGRSEFEEYFVQYRDHPSNYWNAQAYTSLWHSLLAAFTNDTCIKYSISTQDYNIVNAHSHEI